MNLRTTLHILAHGQNLPSAFIEKARETLSTLSSEEQAALASAIDAATANEAPEEPVKNDNKGK